MSRFTKGTKFIFYVKFYCINYYPVSSFLSKRKNTNSQKSISYKNKNATKRKAAKKSLKQKSNKKVSDKKADDIFTKEENIKINRNDIQYENDDERLIIEALGSETKHADELIRETGLQAVNLHTSMIMLEMRGIVKSMPGNYFKMNI